MGGGKGKSSSPVTIGAPQIGTNPYEEQLAAYASGMWNQTQAPRTYIGKDWETFFNPAEGRKYDPSQLPAFSPLYNLSRTGLEDQYGVAKENILSTLPRGGAMGRSLANLETGRAKDIGSLQSSISAPIISDLYNKAYNAGFVTGPNQAIGGMGAADQSWNQRNISQAQLDMDATKAALAMTAQQNQAANAGSSAKGMGLGSALGKGLGSIVPGIGTAIGGSIAGGVGNIASSIGSSMGKGSPGITSGLGGYTALANAANPLMWGK
jgi:hypothetical protein